MTRIFLFIYLSLTVARRYYTYHVLYYWVEARSVNVKNTTFFSLNIYILYGEPAQLSV